jgi:ABC-type Fe3+/spermidine/putrescine transport system ATPase subunit
MESDILLEVQNISFSFEQKIILDDITFKLHSNECIAILGSSGTGKSTLLSVLAGKTNADRGAVLFRGKPLVDPREQLIRGHREIKLVDQDFELDLFHNVEENLRIKLSGYTESVKKELINEILDTFSLKSFSKQQARNLSGGEQQRLALARALIQEPDVLLLDEPFIHLDFGLRQPIENFIKQKMKSWHGGIILVTHDGREAMSWADTVIYIADNRISRVDNPVNFYEQPRSKKEAEHFGPINEIKLGSHTRLFRPNAYRIEHHGALKLTKKETKYLGTHYENLMESPSHGIILLYSQHELPDQLSIEPHYVGE